MSLATRSALAVALEGIGGEALAPALDALLHAWRSKRDPEIADLVDEVSKLCREGQDKLEGESAAKRAAWDEVARVCAPIDLQRLLEALVLRTSDDTAARIEVLAAHAATAPNPRLASGLTEVLTEHTFAWSHKPFWRAVRKALVATRDPRLLDRLSLPFTFSEDWVRSDITRAHERTDLDREPLEEEEKALCAAIRDKLAARAARRGTENRPGEDLLASVYAAPDDDGPRQVYADWLTQRGDPRGELIVLQYQRLAGETSRKSAAREKALIKEHAKEWCGPIWDYVRRDDVVFERGFPARVRVSTDPLGGFKDDAWSTVVELDFSRTAVTADATLRLVLSPGLRGLRAIVGVDPAFFDRFATGTDEIGQPVKSPNRHKKLLARLERIGGRGPLRGVDGLRTLKANAPSLRAVTWIGLESDEAIETLSEACASLGLTLG